MKVLVIHTAYKHKGGEDVVVANEVELLKSQGITVETLLFSNAGNTIVKMMQLPFNIKSYFETRKILKTFQPDIVHIHNLHLAGSASPMYAVKHAKVPFVVTLHNYRLLCPSATLFKNGDFFTDSVNKNFSWKAVKEKVYKNSFFTTFWLSVTMLIHKLLRTWEMADQFIVLGQYSKEIIQHSKYKNLVEKISIKPNFCYGPGAYQNGEKSYYLYVGRLSEEKGIGILLETFSKNGLPLKIAGTGPLKGKVKKAGHKYKNIEFLGSIDPDGVQSLLADAKALIFPSVWYEPFGMVIIEAYASSIPVIASDLGQLKTTVTHGYNGLRFEAGSAVDLENKVTLYERLTHDEQAQYQANAYKSYEENYSPEVNAKQLLAIYNEALNKKTGNKYLV